MKRIETASFGVALFSLLLLPLCSAQEQLEVTALEDWHIVVDESAIPSERYAAEEFQALWKRATEIDLPIEAKPPRPDRNIFIGPKAAAGTGSQSSEADDLREEGLRISITPNNISITGGIVHSADFETGNDGWDILPPSGGPGGEWSNLVALADLPAPLTPCDCATQDTALVFDDLSQGGGHNLFADNLAASPWIDLKAAGLVGTPGKIMSYDVYAEMPLLNYVFAQK